MKGSVRKSMSETGVAISLLPCIAGLEKLYSEDSESLNGIDTTATVMAQSAGEKGNPENVSNSLRKDYILNYEPEHRNCRTLRTSWSCIQI